MMTNSYRRRYEQHRDYIQQEGLDELVDFDAQLARSTENNDDAGSTPIPIAPDPADLVRLHRLVRERRPFTILEFGVGYSTLVMADALRKNRSEWMALQDRPSVRNRYMFQSFAVDASGAWIAHLREQIPSHLGGIIHLSHSELEIGTHNGQLCHFYKELPDVVADFVYLDGPDPKDVVGSRNGLTFQCDERTVMAADLLLMEPTFLPGTFILVDGRTNNARFLRNNFRRDYDYRWDPEADVTTFDLQEARLGKYNVLGTDAFK